MVRKTKSKTKTKSRSKIKKVSKRKSVKKPTRNPDKEDFREKLEYFWLSQRPVIIRSNGKKNFKGLIKPNEEYKNWFKVYNYSGDGFNVIWIKLDNILAINSGDDIEVSSYLTTLYPPVKDRL